MSIDEHKSHAPAPPAVRVAVITVSDTRTLATDEGGRLVAELCRGAGFGLVATRILRDEATELTDVVAQLCASGEIDAVLLTGGTGLSSRDSTIEAMSRVFEKVIDGYGELFRALSFAEIGSAAMLSRATAGTRGRAVIFTMPGSPAGVRLAMEKLILPELPHIVAELHRHGHHDHHEHHGHHDKHGHHGKHQD